MRPGTAHCVITLEDSLCVGGHFFSSLVFSRTLFACIAEHFVGDSTTNTEHSSSHIILFKLFAKYASVGLESPGEDKTLILTM